MSSAHLVERVREAIGCGGELDERVDTLVVRGRIPSADAQRFWIALVDNVPAPFASIQVYDPSLGGDLLAEDAFDPSREVVITVGKSAVEGCAFFVFQSAVTSYLLQRDVAVRIAVADLLAAQAFRSRSMEVVSWNLDSAVGAPAIPANAIDPTRYVKDFVPQREVVTDLSPWILLTPPAEESPVFRTWEAVAARRLLASLVSRVWLEDGHVWLQAAGPPIYRIRADDAAVPSARSSLTEAANWVFLSGADVEARHLLFSGELARASRPNQELVTTIDRAVEAAKAAYEAHVQSSSRETLRTLADLRKTVIDETQKVAQRAQDLTATLWRDLAISATPFFLKILGDAGKASSVAISATFYFAAAGFIALSFVLQWRINQSFFNSQRASRQRWMQTLYSYISAREREEIAEAPIEQALKNYRETRSVLLIVYLLLVVALIGVGIRTLGSDAPKAVDNANVPSAPQPSATSP